ncbi:hypothetical protein ACXR0O_25885 [Verrucomicrobiota bacterium sgz303538]
MIFTFAYSDSSVEGWPKSPDGDGATLVLKRPFHTSTDPGLPNSWRLSTATGGAPGQVDSTLFSGNPTADAGGDGYSALVEYALGTSGNEAESIPQLTIVRDEQGRLQISTSHPVTADDVVIEALESTNLTNWSAIQLQEEVPVGNSAQYRSTSQSTTSGPDVFLRLRVRQN